MNIDSNSKVILFAFLLLFLTGLACGSGQESVNNSSPSENSDGASQAESNSYNGQNDNPWQLVWQLNTGAINTINVAEDGTVYGITRSDNPQHITISSEGKVIRTQDIDLGRAEDKCGGTILRDRFTPFSNAQGMWQDGSIICPSVLELYVVSPNGSVRVIDVERLFPNSDVIVAAPLTYYDLVAVGDALTHNLYFMDLEGNIQHQTYTGSSTRLYEKRTWYGLSFDTPTKQFLFYDGDESNLIYRGRPDGLEWENVDRMKVTRWGHSYIYYNTYDENGFKLDEKIFHIREDGTTRYLVDDPYDLSYVTDEDDGHFFYIPFLEQIYYVGDFGFDKFLVLNLDLEVIAEYDVPLEKPFSIDKDDMFIGHDGALYIWKRGDVLYKYELVPIIES